MGWFWADTAPPSAACPVKLPSSHPPISGDNAPTKAPSRGCPMHHATVDALSVHTIAAPSGDSPSGTHGAAPSGCPVPHAQRHADDRANAPSTLSKLNPLNYMFRDLPQARAPHQTVALPTDREASTIPRGDGDGTWEYPSPQQMYHALLRKGYTDTDATAVESMVAVHNFLNEGAWAEIVEWERRFGGGLARGWQISRRGEENAAAAATAHVSGRNGELAPEAEAEPRLIRFQGRPGDMTPKAALVQLLGRVYPSKFATEPPFDRHDWYVARNVDGREKQVRYVIDYYSGPPEPTGEPVFYLDVRPALTPTGAVERLMRWGGDVWWRASGGEARDASRGA